MQTLYFIIALFALGATFGLYLLSLVLRKKETPKFVSIIHGTFVVSAFLLLIYSAFKHGLDGLTESIVLFALAAIIGITLILRDLTGKSLPWWLAAGHGFIAVTGFAFLLLYAFS